MDLTVSSYRAQQPAFKGLVKQSFTDSLFHAAEGELNKTRQIAKKSITEINEGQLKANNEQIVNWAVGLKDHFTNYMSRMHDSISLIKQEMTLGGSLGYLLKMGDYTSFIPMEHLIENINSCKGLDKFDVIANACKIEKWKYDRNLEPQNINRQTTIQLEGVLASSLQPVKMSGILKPKFIQRRFLNEMMEQGKLNLAERFARETNDLDYYTKNLQHALDAIEYRETNAEKIIETNNLYTSAVNELKKQFFKSTQN